MTIKVFDVESDGVIESIVANARADYGYAVENLYPLIGRFDAQRKEQDKKFYQRLERDLVDGCIMPPLTIAFVDDEFSKKIENMDIQTFVNQNISKGYVLDGIQRLNTLNRAKEHDDFDPKRPIYLNIIVAPTEDKLLYRMITLNNGQKPMTPRHQIEILTRELFDFSDYEIDIQTEKERASNPIKGAFSLGDISKAYLAFLTDEVNNENNKIIGEKMDQIIVGRIMEKKPMSSDLDFKQVLKIIERLVDNDDVKKWLKVSNNLIGFCVGVKSSHKYISEKNTEDFERDISLFEEAFEAINPSKVNVGRYRRQLSQFFIRNLSEFSELDELSLVERFMEYTS
ncbi:hypothetical protein [Methylophaga thalassica]|uniref:hypothetical protein n=1 Tax=Methylophaga thalassica TaxID=40223 RepID=UPI002E7B85C9|nr:hypothetical protein [Methylophaga thalassica]WVI85466.1 hypothetical protein VSX76_02345 [Methylophaga thalassica]